MGSSTQRILAISRGLQGGPVLDSASRDASLHRVRQRADQQFVRVERAYRVLSDPVKRQVSCSFLWLIQVL